MATVFEWDARRGGLRIHKKYWVFVGEDNDGDCKFETTYILELGRDGVFSSTTEWGPVRDTLHRCPDGSVVPCKSITYKTTMSIGIEAFGVKIKPNVKTYSGNLTICACNCRGGVATPGRVLPANQKLDEEYLDKITEWE